MPDTRRVCVWPNDDYCELDDLTEYQRELGLSDDYYVMDVPADADDDEVELRVRAANRRSAL